MVIPDLKYNLLLDESIVGNTVTITGRLWHKEFSSKYNTIILHIADYRDIYSCRFNKENKLAQQITNETFIKVSGKVVKVSFKTLHPRNILIDGNSIRNISEISESDEDINRNLESIRFLFIRKPEIKYLLLIKQKIRKYLSNYLENEGYLFFETPIITSLPQVNRKAIKTIISKRSNLSSKNMYLIQKSQYFLEAFAHSFHKVYTITPAFRVDHRESNFLLAEFWLIEVEEIFSTMKEQMNLVEKALKYISTQLLIKNGFLLENLIKYRELDKLNKNNLVISELSNEFWNNVYQKTSDFKEYLRDVNRKFPRLKYKDVLDEFNRKGEYFSTPHLREKRGQMLTSVHNSPVFVYEFPFSTRQFYDKKCPENNEFTHTFDLIGHRGYGEIASGGEREYRADFVEKQIKEKKLRLDNNQTLQWYHKYKKYGSIPHAGFSIGLERLTAWLTNTDHISKTIGFPRRLVGNDLYY